MKVIVIRIITFHERENSMKYFKTEAKRNAPRYIITPESFQANTKEKYPFVQAASSGKLTAYGICPSCHNPVQLIGIFNEIKTAPYGRHTGKTISDLPEWNFRKYKYCPYAKDNYIQPNEKELLTEIDNNVIELYDLLKNQFDRVVYIIQKELHIRCSKQFWANTLKQYIVSKGYCYPWLTESNLPYIFAYRGMQQRTCFGQEFEVGTDLYKTLKAHPNVKFTETEHKQGFERLINDEGKFIKLVFRLTNHRQIAKYGEPLKETIQFCIDDNSNGNTVYEQEIEFSETYFINVVNKEVNSNKRQKWLIDIANELMPDLI